MTTPDPQATPFKPEDAAQVSAPEVSASEATATDVTAETSVPEVATADVPELDVPAPEVAPIDVPAPEVPAPQTASYEAPTFPQSAAPSFDEATATPGATTYGTAYDAPPAYPHAEQPAYGAPADPYAQPEQGAYGAPGAQAYGQPGFEQGAYAAGQQAYAQPGYSQPMFGIAPKQWIVALLLAFFLGGFGVHNFYLGYTTRGIIQLVLTLTFFGAIISAFWALVEFFLILVRSGSYGYDAQGQPLE